jgi:hypothetical protein
VSEMTNCNCHNLPYPDCPNVAGHSTPQPPAPLPQRWPTDVTSPGPTQQPGSQPPAPEPAKPILSNNDYYKALRGHGKLVAGNTSAEQPVSAAPPSAEYFWYRTDVDEYPWGRFANHDAIFRFAEAYSASLRHEIAALLKPLKDACDRDWKDETSEQIVAIAANAIYWRHIECCDGVPKSPQLENKGVSALEAEIAALKEENEKLRSEATNRAHLA